MQRTILGFTAGLVLAALSTSSVQAGKLYVPIEPTASDDQTLITISNPGGDLAAIEYYLIPPFADGTERPSQLPIRYIPPGQSIVLRSSLPLGQRGLLEISSSELLPVTARLGKTSDGPEGVMGASVPIITSANMGQPGKNLYLQGLQRDTNGSVLSNFRIVNLGTEVGTCNLTVNDLVGNLLGGFLVFPDRQPLSTTNFDDALLALGNISRGDIRVRVSCDQPFFTYFVSYEASTQRTVITGPAGIPNILPPDAPPPPPPPNGSCGTAGVHCFQHAGVFHTPTSGNKVKRLAFPTPPGDYHRLHVRMEVTVGNWQTPTSGLHNIFWLALDRNRNLIGYVNLKGPNSNSVLFRHGFGQPQEDKAKVTVSALFTPGETYTFDYTFDTTDQIILLIVTDASGQEVTRILHSPDTNKIRVTNNEIVLMDFGFTGVNYNEPPTIGWTYKNLTMEIE